MLHMLRMATVIVVLAFAATSFAQARAIHHRTATFTPAMRVQ